MNPREAVIRLTNACNARCRMCAVGDGEKINQLDNALLEKLPCSLKSVSLSGGEPFLRDDLWEIVGRVKARCSKSRIVISTNGIFTDVIKEQMKRIIKIDPKIAIRISIDGIGDIHDNIRGVRGAYGCVMNTLRSIKGLGAQDLGITITISDGNIEEIKKVYNLSKEEKVKFNCQIVHSSDFYYRRKNDEIIQKDLLKKSLNAIIASELRSWNLQRLFKTYYYRGIWRHVNRLPRSYSCNAGNSFFYLSQEGSVYPCQFLNLEMGNLHNDSFYTIWDSKEAYQAREQAKRCNLNCWTVCTVAPAIKDKPCRAARWVFINKLRVHLGNSHLL